MTPPPLQVRITPSTFFIALGVGALVWLLVLIHPLVFILLLAGLLAAALYPGVAWMRRRGLSGGIGILLFYVLFLLVMGALGIRIGSLLLEQGRQFVTVFPMYLDAATAFLRQFPGLETTFFSSLSRYLGTLGEHALSVFLSTLNYLKVFANGVVNLLLVLLFTFFFLSDTPYFEGAVLRLVPEGHRLQVQRLVRTIARQAGAYIRGQFLVMLGVGLLVWIGLSLIGVPYSALLGALTFLLDIVPLIGPLIAGGISVLVALGQDPALGLWTLLIFLVAQQVESYVLSPLILGRTLGLHPFWIMFGILVGASTFGLVGVILAVPTTVTLGILLEEFFPTGNLPEES